MSITLNFKTRSYRIPACTVSCTALTRQ